MNPPIENIVINPNAHSIGISIFMREFDIVASQLKILIPVGIAMIIVAAVKYARVSISKPTVNMWCAHTINPRKPIAIIA